MMHKVCEVLAGMQPVEGHRHQAQLNQPRQLLQLLVQCKVTDRCVKS